MTSTNACLVLTTLGDADAASRFVRELVDRRLVACGTMLPGVRSIYRWMDSIADDNETLVLLKTSRDRVAELKEAFPSLHPYEVPEFLVFPAENGLAEYLGWIERETSTAGKDE